MNYFTKIAIILLLVKPSLAQEPPAKLPIPDETAQKEAAALVQEVFGKEIEEANTPEQQSALVKKLLKEATMPDATPSGRYAILQAALENAPDATAAMSVVDEIAKHFQMDRLMTKASTVWRMSNQAETNLQHKAVAEVALQLIDVSVSRDDYDPAMKLADIAQLAAKKSREKKLIDEVEKKTFEIQKQKVDFEKMQESLALLEKEPTNTGANLAVGNYKCFVKGDWDEGVPMLALGGDEALKKLAVQELAKPTKSDEQVALADGWYELAQKPDEAIKERMLQRAGFWYGLSLKSEPTLARLVKAKVEKRLGETGESIPMDFETKSSPTNDSLAKGLKWMASQQRPDGSWTFATGPNAGTLNAPIAATSMALLPFIRSGNTHESGEYKEAVLKGLEYLGSQIKVGKNGADMGEEGATMYGHGLASIVICEAYARTSDRKLKTPAQQVVNFIVYAQDPQGGGWRYKPRTPGDTSVAGWQMTALKIAEGAKLSVPRQTFQLAGRYLDSVQSDGGIGYGYTQKASSAKSSTTAIGLLCRIYLGAKTENPAIKKGIANTVAAGPDPTNPYFNYYATLLLREADKGTRKKWNERMQKNLLESQEPSGSWFFGGDHLAEKAGRIGTTSLCLTTLVATKE